MPSNRRRSKLSISPMELDEQTTRQLLERLHARENEPDAEELAEAPGPWARRLRQHRLELELQNEQLRETQSQLEESRAHYADLYDFAPVAYFTFNRAGQIENLNLTAAHLMGRQRDYLIGRPFGSMVAPDSRREFLAHLRRCLETRQRVTQQLQLQLSGRGQMTAQLVSTPLGEHESPSSCRTALLDISELERVRRERELLLRSEQGARATAELHVGQLEAVQRELRAAVAARETFMAVASHELKTPLTALALHVEQLKRSLADPARVAKVPALADVLSRQIRRLASLVNGLLDETRAGSGTLGLQPRSVDLVALVRGVAGELTSALTRAGCMLELQLDQAPVVGHWDPLRLEQVVTNLLTNAAKYGAGKPVKLAIAREGNQARLVVTDHGIGIRPEDLERIFGRYERAVSDSNFGGLGLGLYVCKEIVEAMHGTIRAFSELGQGSRFEVLLPLSG